LLDLPTSLNHALGEHILDSIKGCGVACSVLELWFSEENFLNKNIERKGNL